MELCLLNSYEALLTKLNVSAVKTHIQGKQLAIVNVLCLNYSNSSLAGFKLRQIC